MARPASDARDRALAAAFTIAVRDGAASLTIGAVAEEADLSKGGVLHHFPTKDALVLALVESMVMQWEAAVEAQAETDPEPVGRYVRAFFEAITAPELTLVGRGMLAAVALNPDLLEPMRASYLRCQKRIAADGLDPVVAYQCILVADSLWFNAIFDLPAPPAEVVAALRDKLMASTRAT